MKTTKIAAASLTASVLLAGCSDASNPMPGDAKAGNATDAASAPAARWATLGRAEVRALLGRIERAPAPEPEMGAMCYRVARPPDRAEYVCPVCGERTIFRGEDAPAVEGQLAESRRVFRSIPQQGVLTLDETQFCRKCRPAAEHPKLRLIVHFGDGTAHTVDAVTGDDLRLLAGALAGKLYAETSNDGTSPLKTKLPRLRELLGEKSAK